MDWTKLFECIITLITLILSGFVIPWLKSKIDSSKLQKIMQYVTIAVGAAEQIAATNDYNGAWKKDYVEKYLASLGINIDAGTINNLIENAVIQLHNQLKSSET